ncbi:MAG: DMT family transporter [Candidatus Babeliaceae bacterium]|jgi:drug/metabolite transporter (DMT)-like permease
MIEIFIGFALLASGITANKLLLATISPTFFVALRMTCAGLFLVVYHFRTSPRLRPGHMKIDILEVAICALYTTFIPSILKAYALKYLISSKAAFLGSLDPVITALYAYFLLGETLTRNKLLGMGMAFTGTVVLLMATSCTSTISAWCVISYPELAAIIAIAISRYGWLLAQKMLKNERYMPSELNGLMMLFGGCYALLAAFFIESDSLSTLCFTPKFTALFAYTVIVGNVIAYGMYATFLKNYTATFVSLVGLSVPLFVHLYGPLVIGEPLSPYFFTALSITFCGLYIFYKDELLKKA